LAPGPICSGDTTNINLSSGVAGTTFSWSATQNGVFGATSGSGNTISQTLTTVGLVQGSVIYTVTAMSNGCIGTPITIPITVKPTPEVFGSAGSTICSGDQTSINLSPSIPGTTFDWSVVSNGLTGAVNGSGSSISQILVTTGTSVGIATYTVIPTFDGCSGTPITIVETVNPAPLPNIADGIICVTQTTGATFQPYTLDTQLSNTYDFVWYLEGTIIPGATANTWVATQAGQYSVIATNDITGCISDEVFADVTAAFPGEIISIDQTLAFSENGTITVSINGSGIYEYQLDNGPFQISNIFTGVLPGSHTVSVRDTNGCTDLGPITVVIIGYPHYFSPNADGINDTWNIIGLNTQPTSINIFDRQGKFIKQISSTGTGWDGTYNGRPLPSTDYWFTVEYMESGINKTFKAHFSLKR
jgi:gliding motility-associated-like protein